MTRKKTKPSFDIDRPAAERGTSWVYPPGKPAGDLPPALPAPPPVRVLPSASPASGATSTVDLLVMPMAIALTIALAPVQWLLARRRGTGV